MAGEGQKIDADSLHVNRADAGGLGDIHREPDTGRAGDGGNFANGQQGPRNIRGVQDQNQSRVRTKGASDRVRVQAAATVARRNRQADAPGFEFPQRPHYRIVLHRTDDDMIAGIQKSEQKQIDCFRGVFRKDQTVRGRRVEQGGQRVTNLIDHAGGRQRFAMAGPAGAATAIFQVVLHGGQDSGRLGPGCGGVIKINRQTEHLLSDALYHRAGRKTCRHSQSTTVETKRSPAPMKLWP